jgi:hypothetical protein
VRRFLVLRAGEVASFAASSYHLRVIRAHLRQIDKCQTLGRATINHSRPRHVERTDCHSNMAAQLQERNEAVHMLEPCTYSSPARICTIKGAEKGNEASSSAGASNGNVIVALVMPHRRKYTKFRSGAGVAEPEPKNGARWWWWCLGVDGDGVEGKHEGRSISMQHISSKGYRPTAIMRPGPCKYTPRTSQRH